MKVFTLLFLLILSGFATVQAAPRRLSGIPMKPPTAPFVVLTPAEKAAKAMLDRMSAHLSNAEGLIYSANISFATGSPGNVITRQISDQVTVEKYAKMYIQAFDSGQLQGVINADGSTLTLYDAVAGKYSNVKTSSDLESALNALEVGGRQVFSTPSPIESDLYVAFAFPDLFFAGRYYNQDAVNGVTVHYAMTASTINGKESDLLTQTFSRGPVSRTLAFVIDPTDYNLEQFSQSETVGTTAPVTVLKVDFTSFQQVKAPLPASTYSFVPPSTAALVQNPAPAAPTVSSPAVNAPSTPQTPTPSPAPPTTNQ